MKLIVVSVYDRASEVFGRPAFIPARGAAIRSFTDEVNRVDANNELNRHPDDFDLYILGEFEDSQGIFTLDDNGPTVLVRGKDVVNT